MSSKKINCIGVLTSGGDAQGMNPAVRAVVRTALHYGIDVYGIHQGYQGMVDGGDAIKKMKWSDVSGIINRGGTLIGTARSNDFREKEGRLKAAKNLAEKKIDKLVVIGGDGSLTGANIFREEWPELLQELVKQKKLTKEQTEDIPTLKIVGLVGSIDNDMVGTDWTIGTNTALKRIVDAIDIIESTAASHQRTFIVEVMGRNCGYLALMSALSTGADYVLIPENPPESTHWEQEMCDTLIDNRKAGKKESIVVLSEGAKDRKGNLITGDYLKNVLKEQINEDARLTILGHVQRGGPPTSFDRFMSTWQGYEAVRHLIKNNGKGKSVMIGMHRNRVTVKPLMECVEKTRQVAVFEKQGDYKNAVKFRGNEFREALEIYKVIQKSVPKRQTPDGKRILVMNASGPSPGMNIAVRAAVRYGIDQGFNMLGVKNGFEGLISGEIRQLDWMEVEDWTSLGGSVLGTNRTTPASKDFYAMSKNLEKFEIDAILMIGGTTGYRIIYDMYKKNNDFPKFDIPTICLPASIANNLPGTSYSIGSDTALNNIVEAVDKIKESAIAQNRTFVVEVMGKKCGYLAMMSGLNTGAERVYLPEEGITLKDLKDDVDKFSDGFRKGKSLGLVIRNESANDIYTTHFISDLYEEEGGDLFDVRTAILGHLQQGGSPTPFDRIIATTLGTKAAEWLTRKVTLGEKGCMMIGIEGGNVLYTDMMDLPKVYDATLNRPREQWWYKLKNLARTFERNEP